MFIRKKACFSQNESCHDWSGLKISVGLPLTTSTKASTGQHKHAYPASYYFNYHTIDDHNEERMEEAYDDSELSDDEFEEQSFDHLLDRVESNDPSLTKLKVRLHTIVLYLNNAHRYLERLGTAIGRNTQLKALRCDGYCEQINAAQVNLFRGIACSRSIKRFDFRRCGEHLGHICRILTPLFKNNQAERIRFDNCELSLESTHVLVTSLAMFDSLKEFALIHASIQHIPQEVARQIVQSLSGHSRLRKLDLSLTEVGKHGCSALVDLLSNPNTNLRVLNLTYNNLGDDEAIALSSVIASNISLKEINLSSNGAIGQAGWQAIFGALSSPSCRLEKIVLQGNKINDSTVQPLSDALTSNTTLKTLNLGYNGSITPTDWHALFQALRSPTCILEDINLSKNLLNDEGMVSLIDALASNRSLISLNISSNSGVTGDVWQRFFSTVLANPSSGLEKLNIGSCNINDAAIRALTNALVNNSKLKVLTFKGDYHIANTGWEMFSSVLESPNTALEELDLQGNVINDATLTSLMNSLANNKKLEKLSFQHRGNWQPHVGIVCNTDSIMDTYNSNHILEKLGDGYSPLPEEFESLLQINRENSPSQAARLKIIKTHFNGGFITQPFVGMDLNILPYAIAWMGRDGEVNDHFYGFIRSMTPLFKKGQHVEEE